MSTTNANFLENLLLYRIHGEREVPSEGPGEGVNFIIDYRKPQQALCIIFHIDKESTNKPLPPLPNYKGERPDYLVLYAQSGNCICSIIELKAGKNRQAISKSIRQITNFQQHLAAEIERVFGDYVKIHFQGIILTRFLNDKMQDPETRKLLRTATCPITILQSPPKPKLLQYVERKLQKLEKYTEDGHAHSKNDNSNLNFLEDLLVKSVKDQQFTDKKLVKPNGVNVNFKRLPCRLTLHADKKSFQLYHQDAQQNSRKYIDQALQKLGLSSSLIDQILISQ